MKKSILRNLSFLFLFSFILVSCGKYEDGPNISLLTKKARLTGEWEVKEIDKTKLDSDVRMILEFEKNGDFEITLSFYDGTNWQSEKEKGEWKWEDGKEKIRVEIDRDITEFEILRLTNKELWFEDEDGTEMRLEKK